MNDIFYKFLDDFVVCYLKNILVYFKNKKDHKNHLWLVLERLRTIELYDKLEKCVFY